MDIDTFHKEIVERLSKIEALGEQTFKEARKTNGRVSLLEQRERDYAKDFSKYAGDVHELKTWRGKVQERERASMDKWIERALWLIGAVALAALTKLDILNIGV